MSDPLNKKYDGVISGVLPGDELLISDAMNRFDIIEMSKHLRKDGKLIVFLHVQAINKEELNKFFDAMMIGSTPSDSETDGDF